MDLKLKRGKDEGDLIFTNGACPITTNFTESTAQRVYIQLRTFQGEWYLDEDTGVPYLQRILGHKVSKATVDRIIQERVLAVEGVGSISDFTSSVNSERVYEASMKIRDTSGGTFEDTTSFPLN